MPGDDFTAFAGFHRAVDFHQPFGDKDFGLRAAFAPAFQLQQVTQFNMRVFAQRKFAILGLLNVVILFARLQRILNEGRYGHRPTPPHWRNVGRAFRRVFKHHVADHFAAFQTVNADVHHDGAFFNPLARDKARFTDCDNQQIGIFNVVAQVLVKRWVTVVVQPASSSSMLIGRPTMLEAPITTALRP